MEGESPFPTARASPRLSTKMRCRWPCPLRPRTARRAAVAAARPSSTAMSSSRWNSQWKRTP
eukprot:4224879-Pyramimonas_sp.AAC.1